MEEMIREELHLFTEEIRRSEGEPFDFINKFDLPILNALWNVTVQRVKGLSTTIQS